jgi:hypothetical protein
MNKELAGWLQDVAPGLPADVIQIEEDSYTISVYWHERIKGEEQAVLDFLKNSGELLLIEPSPGGTAE